MEAAPNCLGSLHIRHTDSAVWVTGSRVPLVFSHMSHLGLGLMILRTWRVAFLECILEMLS